jgi:putative peptide zinc metalloprotease protein
VTRGVRRGAAALLTVLACALPAGSAQAAHRENIAQATIEQDAGRAFDMAWDISRQRGGVVDHANKAHAAGRCTGCEATAIAFQIVLVSGAPSRVAPTNEAVALNLECPNCEVVAEARQFVRVLDQPVRLTGAGRRELADVRATLRALEAQDPPIDQLHQAVESQEARVRQVLNTELVLRSDPSEEADVIDAQLAQDADQG